MAASAIATIEIPTHVGLVSHALDGHNEPDFVSTACDAACTVVVAPKMGQEKG
jgi:hypothetical protein